MESGFIYLWFDRKHKRFYLGKHWGTPDDGYVCSSTWMKQAYKRRPQDFTYPSGKPRRKILETVHTNRKDLGEAEKRWGLLIKETELGTRYYNLKRPEDHHWHDDPDTLLTVAQKISKSKKGRVMSEEQKRKISEGMKKAAMPGLRKPKSEEHKRKLSKTTKKAYKDGRLENPWSGERSEEHCRKLSESAKKQSPKRNSKGRFS